MPLSPFFLHGSPSEQRLVQDLVNEHLKMFGQDVLYMPRRIVNEKTVIKEITASRFDDSFRLEAYLVNFDGFGTPSDVLSKFGVRATDEITLVVSKERYDDFISPFLKLWPADEIKVAHTPQEGDLIYLPLDNALFEIKYVERKVPFYQMNDLFMYELRCEIFEVEDEIIDLPDSLTDKEGVPVEDTIATMGQVVSLQMATEANQDALATVSLASTIIGTKSVQYVQMFDDGNYKGTPSVYIHKPTRGHQATGTVTIADGAIQTTSITFGGTNYINVPNVSFTPPNRTTSANIKFGNNSLHHSNDTDVNGANFKFTSNVDSFPAGDGRLSFSFWFYPTQFDQDPNYGAAIMWTDRFKIYHRETGNVVFASGSGSIENTTQLTLNAWNFIRVEQYNQDATISVNGTVSNNLGTADPILFFANDQLKLGADTAGAGKNPIVTKGFKGFLDHITLNLTGDSGFRTSSSQLVPTTTAQQESDPQTATVAQFINNLNNELPTVIAGLNTAREVTSLTINHPGNGYTSVPIMTIEQPNLGDQATAVAIMTSRTGVSGKAIDRILLINPGTGYTTPPPISFSGGSPNSVAIATAIVSEACLGPVAITTGGQGYTFTPTVGITSVWIQQSTSTTGNILNAKAEAVVSTSNTVTQIRYSNAGAGYTSTAAIVGISSVVATSFGNYEGGETVVGGKTGTEALVSSWDAANRILKVSIPSGNFALGESVVGAGASYTVSSIENDFGNLDFASNEEIELEADNIIDFTENNPFGEF